MSGGAPRTELKEIDLGYEDGFSARNGLTRGLMLRKRETIPWNYSTERARGKSMLTNPPVNSFIH